MERGGRHVELLTLCGAPASGKLTVAKEVARRTGFLLFHNHLTFGVASSVFSYGSERFEKLCWDLRMAVFESVAAADAAGIIFTWAYSHPEHQRYVSMLESLNERWKVELLSAYLVCNNEERKRRVSNPSRSELGKVASLERLSEIESNKNYSHIPGWPSIRVDTTRANPDDAAAFIIRHFGLPIISCGDES